MKTISEQSGKYIACLEQFNHLKDNLLQALCDEFGEDRAEQLMNERAGAMDQTRGVIEYFLLQSINEKINTLNNTEI